MSNISPVWSMPSIRGLIRSSSSAVGPTASTDCTLWRSRSTTSLWELSTRMSPSHSHLPQKGRAIRERLLENGFREQLMGETQPPAAHYHVESGDNGFYAEFLTPLEGSEVKRGGRRDVTTTVSGVSVQKLRHLGVLLEDPGKS